ncbi:MULTISPECIES: hypothetical protein [Vibrio]|uniref:hypothetical protein n=1 Tax=Vibrio TaxID=662 RepID=UPI000A37295C|nr:MULTISPECIES: hypothetical protein [Vibrio]MCG6281471.1 hypothetical protein [Vibrio diabolicus]PWF66983.1 hypothetical protein CCD93_15740 [Vibrio sp. T21]EGR1171972.1 hypothetical protein [Vibrio parahaemolyticus]EHH2559164.1 hypothetical protein [Vibrio parahaemolyticus]EII5834023.1 hypothetical protein [Vibrio parahaemolyticus]
MRKRYTELNNLWCHKKLAVSVIMDHLKDNEPSSYYLSAQFKEGWVVDNYDESYTVNMSFSVYNESIDSNIELHLQVFSSKNDEIGSVTRM